MRKFEERMEALRGDLKKERDKSQRKNLKDIGEVNIHSSRNILYTVKFTKSCEGGNFSHIFMIN